MWGTVGIRVRRIKHLRTGGSRGLRHLTHYLPQLLLPAEN